MKYSKLLCFLAAVISLFCFVCLSAFASSDTELTVVTDEDELAAALSSGGEVRLGSDVTLSEMLTIPEGADVTLDLFGFTLSADDEKNTYALNNRGCLTLLDSVGTGALNSRGIYNGYDEGGSYVAGASLTVLSGTYNAKGTNGGAAVFNYARLVIDGGKFTSVGAYSINTKEGSFTVINNATVTGGIYNLGNMTVNGGDVSNNRTNSYAVYNSGATLVINGGSFKNVNASYATVSSSGASSVTINDGSFSVGKKYYVLDGVGFVINGGSFNGGMRCTGVVINGGDFIDNGMGYRVSSGRVSGGSFADEASFEMATANLSEGCVLKKDADGVGGVVINCKDAVLDGAKYNLTTMTSFIGNLYIRVPEDGVGYKVWAEDADTYVCITEIDGMDYYAFSATPSVGNITSDIVFDISADFDGTVINLSVDFTADSYFADVMSRYSSIAEPSESNIDNMSLIMNATRYANELYKYATDNEDYPAYAALLNNADYAKYLTAVTKDSVADDVVSNVSGLADVFSSANLEIQTGYGANYILNVKEGYDVSKIANVSITYDKIGAAAIEETAMTLTYSAEKNAYVADEMPIYDMLATLTITVDFVDEAEADATGEYNLAAYASGSDSAIGYAIYAYAEASYEYKVVRASEQ